MLNLRYYPDEDASDIVFRKVYVIGGKDIDGNPIDRTVTDAHFKIAVDEAEIVDLTIGNGISWDDITKSLVLTLTNGDLSEISQSTDGLFQLYITIETGRIITLFSGRAYMERSL
ncbi:uncharacterized protein PY1_contig-01-22 [Novosphingobium sp. PY1]|nr:uncharacterized protein PY1_contig-01-22 [Novosphingobium sp. PY1]